jgi:hypothetical protein
MWSHMLVSTYDTAEVQMFNLKKHSPRFYISEIQFVAVFNFLLNLTDSQHYFVTQILTLITKDAKFFL